MAYLLRDWMIDGELIEKGRWIPETGWGRWKARDPSRNFRSAWDSRGVSPLPNISPLQYEEKYMEVLGADIGSAERDGLFYSNFVETLKNDPTNATADDIVDRMQTLGFASASWPYDVGGPPPHESPRPWRKVLNWLLNLIGQVGQFLLKAATSSMPMLERCGVSEISVGIALPPSVHFDFPVKISGQPEVFTRMQQFLNHIMVEMGDQAVE